MKHISKMSVSERGRFNQDVQELLLLIIHSQGRPVKLSLDDAQKITENHRLIFERTTNPVTGETYVALSVERSDTIIKPEKTIIQ